ncbi:FAD-dependent oxidoreductase [Microbacteriaceae bacterium K1510]|nr:FAD-dependent oxidoreductase [Microbacteriaceae bacterium K1510]
MVGKIAGTAAVYETMVALDLVKVPMAWAGPPKLAQGSGAGKTVAILGAGIAGLSAAYELQRAGYNCIILELLDRAGGRNFTARRGTRVVEDSGPNGRTEQVCDFDDGLYMNLGPGRLPHHHHRLMHYCREFEIPLEVYVLSTTANLFQTDTAFKGAAQPRYRIASDTNSHISELLSKAINAHALDDELTQEDRARFKSLLASFGGNSLAAVGGETPRNGCETPMALEALCAANPRLPLRELLDSEFWAHRFYQPDEGEWQPTLFQTVGGMDRIVDAFVKRLRNPIRYGCEVRRIVNRPDKAIVEYRDRKTGKIKRLSADYCLSNMPLQKLAKLEANFSQDFKSAVDYVKAAPLYKLAWQANRRFWEEEPYNIYGGISYTSAPITQMWYPSHGYMGKRGVIAGSYAYGAEAEAFGRMKLAERIAAARRDAIKLHKEFADEKLVPSSKAVSIAWNQVEGQSGGFTPWDLNNAGDRRAYRRLLAPDGRFFVIGDQVSLLSGWQEGALMSSEHAVLQIAGHRPLDAEPEAGQQRYQRP